MVQRKLPLINSAHGSETRNIINELIKLFNGMGYTYDEALQKAHDTLNEAKQTNDKNKDVQNQLNNLIIESGNANAEVSQARGGLPLLKDRLDETDYQLTQKATKKDIRYRGVNVYELGIVDDEKIDQTDKLKDILLSEEYYNIIVPFNIRITSDIIVRSKNNMTIEFTNQSTLITVSCNGLIFTDCQDLVLEKYSSKAYQRNWESVYSGLTIEDCSNPKINLNNIRDYKRGLFLNGNYGGVAYGTVHFNKMYNNETDIYILSTGDGWVTEMDFYSGRFYLGSDVKPITSNTWAVQVFNNGQFRSNNLRFYSPSFEVKHNGIRSDGTEWLILHPRYEGIDNNYITGHISRSTIVFAYGLFHRDKIKLDDQSRNNSIIGKGRDFESSFSTMGGQFSGYAFINSGGLENLGELTYMPSRKSVGLRNAREINQPFNKQYESANIPNTGSFHNGAVVWKYPPTPGETMGWICRYPGTFGTLENVTVNTTANIRKVSFNDSKDLRVGDMVKIKENNYTVDTVFNSKEVQLSPAPTETLTSSPVSFVTPVFIPMPDMPI